MLTALRLSFAATATAAIALTVLCIQAGTTQAAQATSFDVFLRDGSTATIETGASQVILRRTGRSLQLQTGGRSIPIRRWPGPFNPGRLRVEMLSSSATTLALEGTRVRLAHRPEGVFPPKAAGDFLTTSNRPLALLAHRAASLDSRVPEGLCLAGVDPSERAWIARARWDCGALVGLLWEASRLTGSKWLRDRALKRSLASIANPAMESTIETTHDSGSIAEDSARWGADLCRSGRLVDRKLCATLSKSVTRSSATLVGLAATNPSALLVRRPGSPSGAQVIVDSLMNLPVLWWSSARGSDPAAGQLATRHSLWVADHLVDNSGAATQTADLDSRGSIVALRTLQGAQPDGTWARGQAWAINGLAYSADHAERESRAKLRSKAELASRYLLDHLPPDGVPRWDLSLPVGSAPDLSAATIAARGMALLARQCAAAECSRTAAEWHASGCSLLRAHLERASRTPPFGAVYRQVDFFAKGGWKADAELAYTALYALRAARELGRCG